jgi:hypothetical protein
MKKNIIFLLLLISLKSFSKPGDSCYQTIAATLGTNSVTDIATQDLWFSYTATSNGIISIESCSQTTEDTDVRVYVSCTGWGVASNDDYCGKASALEIQCTAGTEYFIMWRNTNVTAAYDWTLTEMPNDAGKACSNPITAIEGTNTTNNSNGEKWFSYTATIDGYIEISSCGTTEDTYVKVYDGCGGNLITESDNNCENASAVKFFSSIGNTYLIKWQGYNTIATYDWILTEDPVPANSVCETAVQAVLGNNIADNFFGEAWFVYTATGDGLITVTDSSGKADPSYDLDVYINCSGDYHTTQTMEFGCSFLAVKDSSYYIRWDDSFNDTLFNWRITEGDILEGYLCDKPRVAVIDSNIASLGFGEQWFTYTTQSDCKLTISNCGLTNLSTRLEVYKTCENDELMWNSSGCNHQSVLDFHSAAGETYLIRWSSSYGNSDFKWVIKEDPIVQGDYHLNPFTIIDPVNVADHTLGEDQWWVYTAQYDGRMDIYSYGYYLTQLYVYDSTLSNPLFSINDVHNMDSVYSYYTQKGQQYYIRWDYLGRDVTYNWVLNEYPVPKGELCSNPETAHVGTNTMANTRRNEWFTYIATKDGKIVIEGCPENTTQTLLGVYNACEGQSVSKNYFTAECSNGIAAEFPCFKDSTYYIVWDNYIKHSFYWTLEEQAVTEGDGCANAIEAETDTNTVNTNGGLKWFKYTARNNGSIKVSFAPPLLDQAKVEAFYSCYDNYRFDYDDGFSSYWGWSTGFSFNCLAGVTYYFKWSSESTSDISWAISETNTTVSSSNAIQSNVSIYPSVTEDEVFISSEEPINNIELYNLYGQRVRFYSNINTISMDGLNNGMYILIVKTINSKQKSFRVVKY